MGITGLIAISIVEAFLLIGAIFFVAQKHGKKSVSADLGDLEKELERRTQLLAELEELSKALISSDELKAKARELIGVSEGLKAEKGRNTITQAELETVDSRLRELEEIERELEASGLEAKEELKILKKKEKDLLNRNEALKTQIQLSLDQMEQIFMEIELSSQAQEQVTAMKTELVTTQSKIDLLLLQIEQSNEQYFTYKQRYDALDIEYAQLYEKFSMSEAG